MKKRAFFSALMALLLLSSCSQYNKVLKSDDYGQKFDMANRLYDEGILPKKKKNGKQKVRKNLLERSIALYQQVYQRLPKESEGEVSYFRIGKAFYLSGDYYGAGYYLGVFPSRFPYSTKNEEAFFLGAMCSVHDSPDWTLDQVPTEIAINDLQTFIDRYPNSTLVDSCNNIIDKLRFKIEKKEFETVKLYSKTENYRSAVTTAVTFVEEYPMSRFKEEAWFLLVKNSYFLSKNSIQNKKKERIEKTLERYSTFVAAFPDSKYRKTLASYDDIMRRELKEINAQEN